MAEVPVSPCSGVFLIQFPDGVEARYTAVTLALTGGRQVLGLLREHPHDRTSTWPPRGVVPAHASAPIIWLELRDPELLPIADSEARILQDGWLDTLLRGLERGANLP